MGEIIAFQSVASSKRAKASEVGEQAQILFFTGVRYARQTQTATEPETRHQHDGGLTPRGGGRRRAR